jgi:FkbM family methyltransferase
MIKEQIRSSLYSFTRILFNSHVGKQIDAVMQRNHFLKQIQSSAIALFDSLTKVDGEKQITLADGSVIFVPRSGSYAALELETTGKYEPEETQLITKYLKKGDTFVEIGGNIGYFSITFSPIVGDKGKIITIEPNPVMVNLLEKSKHSNKAENMTIIPVAIGKEVGKISISSDTFHDMARISFDKGTIPIKPFDMILDEIGVTHIDIATLDIEGAEILALEGMEKVLKDGKISKMLVEVNKGTLEAFKASPIDLLSFLSRYFKLSLLEDPEIEVDIEKLSHMANDVSYINVWCVKK